MLSNGDYLRRLEAILNGRERVSPRQRDLLLLMGMHQLQTQQNHIVAVLNDSVQTLSDVGTKLLAVEERFESHVTWGEARWEEYQRAHADGHEPEEEKIGRVAVTWPWVRDKLATPVVVAVITGVLVYALTH